LYQLSDKRKYFKSCKLGLDKDDDTIIISEKLWEKVAYYKTDLEALFNTSNWIRMSSLSDKFNKRNFYVYALVKDEENLKMIECYCVRIVENGKVEDLFYTMCRKGADISEV
jgi:predicted DNA-binding ArsR family transcriptional regulator